MCLMKIETLSKNESGKSPDGLDYYTSLAYAQEAKISRQDIN